MRLISFLAMSIFLFSCKAIKVSDLNAGPANQVLLPNLEPVIEYTSLETAYTSGSIHSASTNNSNQLNTSTSMLIADKRINDAKTIFQREIQGSISNIKGPKTGYAVCKIVESKTGFRGIGFWFLSIFTAGIPNLFGMPVNKFLTDIDVEVEIRNCKNEILGRYSGHGRKKTKVGLGGYSGVFSIIVTGNEGAARKSNIDAIKIAMMEIKEKIKQDYKVLNAGLSACK